MKNNGNCLLDKIMKTLQTLRERERERERERAAL